MVPPEVIVISDGSELESANGYSYVSDDSEIVVLSVSSPAPQLPPSSQPRADLHGEESGIVSELGSVEIDGDSETEFPDAEGLVSASQSQRMASSGISSRAPSRTHDTVSTTTEGRKGKDLKFTCSSDLEDSLTTEPSKNLARKGNKKTEEEKALEKAKKEEKKEEIKRRKEAATADKAAEKLVKKSHKDANKLVSDKKTTLKDMTVELSPSLLSSSLHALLHRKMQEFGTALLPVTNAIVQNPLTNHETNLNTLDMKLIRWKRRVMATYNEHLRQWLPLEKEDQFTRTEGTYLIFLTRRDALHRISFTEQVSMLRKALGPMHHVHLMLCGWKPSRKEEKEAMERELVRLQVRENVFVEQVSNEDEAVNWIYNMTADLGIKPHKLIQRSHLPFCTVSSSSMRVGMSDGDTMIRMLTQLPRLTDPVAHAVMREYGTINRIMEAYNMTEIESNGTGPTMLADVEVHRTRKGKEGSRVLNKALSERIHSLMWGEDPKTLLN